MYNVYDDMGITIDYGINLQYFDKYFVIILDILYQPVELTNVRSVRESFTRQQMDSQSVRSVVGKSKLFILQIFTECEKLFKLQIFTECENK